MKPSWASPCSSPRVALPVSDYPAAKVYRVVSEPDGGRRVEEAVDEVFRGCRGLRKRGGKKIYELQPDVPWDKGAAVLWLSEALGMEPSEVLLVYIGDDLTDEDAFRALNSQHLRTLETGRTGEDGVYLAVESNQSQILMVQAARTHVFRDGEHAVLERETTTTSGVAEQRLTVECERGKPLRVEKTVALYTSRDFSISHPQLAACQALARAGTFEALRASHVKAWSRPWRRADIEIKGGHDWSQLVLRLHIFHLLQTVSENSIDLDTGVPARGWHGEAYRGHIFWDELFIFPFLNLRFPELTRSLLMYRFRRLPEARRLAEQSGYAGAMFPWQSGSSGREESQVLHLNPESNRWIPDTTHRQRHIHAAIA